MQQWKNNEMKVQQGKQITLNKPKKEVFEIRAEIFRVWYYFFLTFKYIKVIGPE